MDKGKLPLYIDMIFCVILLPVMIMLLPVERWLTHHTVFVLVFVFWLYAVYAIHRRVTIPLVFSRRKYLPALLVLSATILVTWLIARYGDPGHPHGHGRPGPVRPVFHLNPREQGIWFLFLVVTAFSIAVGLLTELYRQMIEKKELEQEKSRAELALYKAQINPHFLFNTLNTLYGLVVTKSDRAEQAFMQFTDLVRYMYSTASADFVPVREEAEYIRQYVGLQKTRLNEHTRVSVTENIRDRDAMIAPLLLMTFVENAFKYGVSSHYDSVIEIAVSVDACRLDFHIRNRIFPEALVKKGDGIGIANCRKRLSLIYPDAHTLDISDAGGYYDVRLTLILDKTGKP